MNIPKINKETEIIFIPTIKQNNKELFIIYEITASFITRDGYENKLTNGSVDPKAYLLKEGENIKVDLLNYDNLEEDQKYLNKILNLFRKEEKNI